MNRHHRSPWRLALACVVAFLLVACRANDAPTVDRGTPSFIRPTPGSPTLRGTAAPRLTPPATSRAEPNLTIAEATLLVDQAIGLLLDYSLAPPTSADLYQAAYDGALRYLAQRGILIDRALLPLTGARGDDAQTFRSAYRALAAHSPVAAEQRPLAYAAARSAIERADQCQTYFIAPEDLDRERTGGSVEEPYGGIGVTLRQTTTGIVVAAVYADSPAAAAGIGPGDRLITLGGAELKAIDATEVGQRLRGASGTALQLGLIRQGETQLRLVTLERALIQPPPFTLRTIATTTGQTVAYLQLNQITAQTLPSLRTAIDDLARQQQPAWVLDLRGSAVGTLDLLPSLAGLMLSADQASKPLGYVVGHAGVASPIVAPSTAARRGPIAILIDGGTALLGEALAAALRDASSARLFGEPTAGCVATSGLYPLRDGAGLRITLDPLLAPDRTALHTVGLRPDEFVLTDPTGASDPVLAMALRWLGQR